MTSLATACPTAPTSVQTLTVEATAVSRTEHAPGWVPRVRRVNDPSPSTPSRSIPETTPGADPDVPRSVVDDLRVQAIDGRPGRFVTHIDDGWRVLHVFGGMSTAVALDAARRVLDRPELRFVSAQATFAAPVAAGGVVVDATILRSGRRGAQVRVALWNSEDPGVDADAALVCDVVFGADGDSSTDLVRPSMPADASSPLASLSRDEVATTRFVEVPFHRQTEWRLAVGSFDPDEPAGDARSVSWFRFRRSPMTTDDVWDPAALAVPGDMLGPAVGRALGPAERNFVITLQLSLQWFVPVSTDWVCQHATVVRGTGGFVTGVCELWSENGELVGFATQCALLRPFARLEADGLRGDERQG